MGGEIGSSMAHLHPHRGDNDQIFQKYLDRAIAEINELADSVSRCELCSDGGQLLPVLGTGHPLADVFLLKHAPRQSEIDEGVAFYGRAGEAILASMNRLQVDPLDIYGSNCIKCARACHECMAVQSPAWLEREIAIVSPRMLVVMGREALDVVNDVSAPESRRLQPILGEVQCWTHTCEVIWCPDIDESLDGPAAKQAFWDAFRPLGEWYASRPPW